MQQDFKPLITIITLNYNSNFLFDTIDSVLQQNYPFIEYIVFDDGSKAFDKNSVEKYIKQNSRGNIKNLLVIRNEKNAGTVKGYNETNKLAKGEIIFNLSSDDCFPNENIISEWVEHFLETKCDISTGLREVYDSTMSKPIKILPKKKDIKAIKTYSNLKLFEYCEYHNIILGCCTAKTKKCSDLIGPINETYRLIEDYPFAVKSLRMHQKISFFDKKVVKYRLGGTSSPINLNKQYLIDSDNIFKNEIEPYTQNKKRANKKYLLWKKRALFRQQYWDIQELYNQSKITAPIMVAKKIILALSHPIIITKKIFERW